MWVCFTGPHGVLRAQFDIVGMRVLGGSETEASD